jgi:DNA-binding transcriptional ArsR family regulator
VTVTQREKAERWDQLLRLLSDPAVHDSHIRHLSTTRRAVMFLLASREELPPALAAELKAYMPTLDELYLEAADGFCDAEGVLNMIPSYITGSLVGELCQPDTAADDEW